MIFLNKTFLWELLAEVLIEQYEFNYPNIPNIDLQLSLFSSIFQKVAFGLRNYDLPKAAH